MQSIRIGTCSWKYPSWEGLVYSSREPQNYLAEYAQKFDTVEVDQWFWSLGKSGVGLPKPETVAEYDAATPGDFRFTVKCPNALTLTHHRGRKGDPLVPNSWFLDRELFLRFLDSLAPLVPKIGLFILQFEYLNHEKIRNRAELMDSLGAFLSGLPADLALAVEIRNPKWIDGPWFDFLAQNKAAPVLLQGYWMDSLATTLDRFGDRIGPTLGIRLHGEDREGMEEKTKEDWSRIVRPKDGELEGISYTIKSQYQRGSSVIINVNNHYEGSAPMTIDKLRRLLGA